MHLLLLHRTVCEWKGHRRSRCNLLQIAIYTYHDKAHHHFINSWDNKKGSVADILTHKFAKNKPGTCCRGNPATNWHYNNPESADCEVSWDFSNLLFLSIIWRLPAVNSIFKTFYAGLKTSLNVIRVENASSRHNTQRDRERGRRRIHR